MEDAALTPCSPSHSWANGYSEEKTLCVPRDAPFHLETCPLTAVDALGNSPVGPQLPSLCPHPAGLVGRGRPWVCRVGGTPWTGNPV